MARDQLGLSPSGPPELVKRGPFSPLTEWVLLADPDIPPGLAWHCWRALSAGLAGSWGQRLLQYVPQLPVYAGYAELDPPGAPLNANLAASRATLYLTSVPTEGFGTSWCAWHSYAAPDLPFAFQPTARVPNCGGWMPDFDWLTIPLSHELAEMLTDPLPGTASGWDNPDGSENADLCNWRRFGVTAPALGDWPAREYGLSQYWCDDLGRCGP